MTISRRAIFFLDSANWRDWESTAREGWLHGVTTNPTILQRAGLECSINTAIDLVRRAADIGLSEIQFQSWGREAAALADRGRALASLSPNVTVKVPATRDGVIAAQQIKAEGYRVTLTACYTVRQCAVARRLGFDYVAPYYGRMIEAGIDADRRLDAMRAVAGEEGPRILIASLRQPEQVDALLARGFDTFTMAPEIARFVAVDPASEAAADAFEEAAERSPTFLGTNFDI